MKRAYLKKKNDPHNSNPSENTLKIILQFSSIFIVLLTALFYLFGRIYYESYLSYWKLSESLFPLDKEQSVFSGFVKVIVYGVSVVSWLSIAILVCLIIVIAVIISCCRPVADSFKGFSSHLRRSAVPALRNYVVITDTHDKVMNAVMLVAISIAVAFILILVFSFSCSTIALKARKNATLDHEEMLASTSSNNKSFSSRAVILVKNEAKGFDQYSGHIIKTSSTHTALYRKDTGVSIFPLANVCRMVIRENKAGVK